MTRLHKTLLVPIMVCGLGLGGAVPPAWSASQSDPGISVGVQGSPLRSTVLFQLDPGFGEWRARSSTLRRDIADSAVVSDSYEEEQSLLGLAFRLRVPFISTTGAGDWAVLWRLRFTIEVSAPTDFSGAAIPCLLGSELSLVNERNGDGWRISPYAMIDFGPSLPVSELGLSDLVWGCQFGFGADLSVPFTRAFLLGISYTHLRWNERERRSLQWSGTLATYRSQRSQSMLRMGLSFPL